MIVNGLPPVVATLAGFCVGAIAGWITGILHTKGKINGLLAGILTQIGLYSINLRIMGGSNLSLIREETLVSPLREAGLMGTWVSIAIFGVLGLAIKFALNWFLNTNKGLAIRATGDKEGMIRSFGVNTDRAKILLLALSNGLIGLCGGLIAQYQGFVDIGMGISADPRLGRVGHHRTGDPHELQRHGGHARRDHGRRAVPNRHHPRAFRRVSTKST